jgi:hypothetical protein
MNIKFNMNQKKQEIFLYDSSILTWERPIKEGYTSTLPIYNGSTKLINQIGFDSIDEEIGPFKIVGSAVKYLADIAHLGKDCLKTNDSIQSDVKREILFSGGLTIYRECRIPGTRIYGYDVERHGEIWIAKKPEKQFYGSNGLKNLVLGDTSNIPERIESILRGYQAQEDEERKQELY